MTARELLDRPIEEILDYFKRQHRTVIDSSLGLETRAVFDFRNRSFRYDNLLKRGEMIVITPDGRYVIYIRNDKDTYKRVRVRFGIYEVEVDIVTCKYITGVIIDRKRFTA